MQKLEDLQKQTLVTNLGVSDLDKPELEELCEAAEVRNLLLCAFNCEHKWFIWQVKPFLNQINIASCCIIPKVLILSLSSK